MSFTEIIHWGALALALVVGAAYTYVVWGATSVDEVTGALLVAIVVLVALVVVFAVAVAVPMAIRSKGNLADERDDAMEAGALPYTFSVLVVGAVWAVLDIISRNAADEAMDPVVTLHILLGSIFVAVVTGSAVTLVRYRVGAR